VVPTPTILHLARNLNARGGICVTASHNPVQWNALKFVDDQGLFLDEGRNQELLDIYHQQHFQLAEESGLRLCAEIDQPTERHFNAVTNYVDAAAIRERKFRVAVDAVNGAGAACTESFLRDRLGCEVVMVNGEPNGLFGREAEPLPEHLGALGEAVRAHRCDLGFAQDPDADRLALVDESGAAIGEDLSLAFAIDQVLTAHQQGPVVVNLSSSSRVLHMARKHGAPIHLTRIGEINVAKGIIAHGAVVGGEPNGGVMIPAIHPCRDSFAGMAVVLEMLAQRGQPLSSLVRGLPAFAMVKDKITIRGERGPDILRAIRRAYAGQPQNLLDGVRVDFPDDSWIHVRLSNTEPVVRLAAEAQDPARAQELAQRVRREIEAVAQA
jgi:phosphomannomutase